MNPEKVLSFAPMSSPRILTSSPGFLVVMTNAPAARARECRQFATVETQLQVPSIEQVIMGAVSTIWQRLSCLRVPRHTPRRVSGRNSHLPPHSIDALGEAALALRPGRGNQRLHCVRRKMRCSGGSD